MGRGKGKQQAPPPRSMPTRKVNLPVSKIQTGPIVRDVPLEDREGVYLHSFICNDCYLHFNIYSWKANRHQSATVTCPECGQSEGRFVHARAVLNENESFGNARDWEIYGHCPWPGSQFMGDARTAEQ